MKKLDCEVIAYLRFRHLGHCLMVRGDYVHVTLSKIMHVIGSVKFVTD
jgi:hypothetical protein